MAIADAAVAGSAPTRDDVVYLLGFAGNTVESAYVETRAREIAFAASEGIATIHAQIGVDANPCPENCQYCSFAAVNAGVCKDAAELSIDAVVASARIFDDLNVHLISLMSTAGLDFDRYLAMVAAVREAVRPDMPILANTRDVTLEEARALKAAGATAAYHAVRIGEGTYTDIDPECRRASIANIRAAGLALMSGVEPVWLGVDVDELADRICEIPGFDSYCTGACGLTSVAGTALADAGIEPAQKGFVRYIGSIVRLVVGYDVRFGGCGGCIWVDAGTDPRNRGYGSNAEVIAKNVHRARHDLIFDGWTVPERADMRWYE